MAETDKNIIVNNTEINETNQEKDENPKEEININDITDKLDNNV